MGYAHAPWVMWVSTHTTPPAPSLVVGRPGNGNGLAWLVIIISVSSKLDLKSQSPAFGWHQGKIPPLAIPCSIRQSRSVCKINRRHESFLLVARSLVAFSARSPGNGCTLTVAIPASKCFSPGTNGFRETQQKPSHHARNSREATDGDGPVRAGEGQALVVWNLRQQIEAAPAGNSKVKIRVYESANHGFYTRGEPEVIRSAHAEATAFLRRHLPRRGAPA